MEIFILDEYFLMYANTAARKNPPQLDKNKTVAESKRVLAVVIVYLNPKNVNLT